MSEKFKVQTTVFDKPEEIWRAIKGHEGHYEVSNYGQVRSLGKEAVRNGHKRSYKTKGKNVTLAYV